MDPALAAHAALWRLKNWEAEWARVHAGVDAALEQYRRLREDRERLLVELETLAASAATAHAPAPAAATDKASSAAGGVAADSAQTDADEKPKQARTKKQDL